MIPLLAGMGWIGKIWQWRNAIIPAVCLAAVAGMWFLADYRLTQKDKAVAARVAAESALKATTESYAAILAAMETDREESHERTEFLQESHKAISAGKLTDRDGALAPVAADAIDRLRSRRAARGEKGNPR